MVTNKNMYINTLGLGSKQHNAGIGLFLFHCAYLQLLAKSLENFFVFVYF